MGDGPPRFPRGSSCPVVLGNIVREPSCLSPTGLSPSMAGLSRRLRLDRWLVTPRPDRNRITRRPSTPVRQRLRAWHLPGLGWIRVRSPLLTESRLLSLPGGTEMVHFPPFASMELCIHSRMTELHSAGFPHSDIPGSTPACGSPRLIAACHVLHRLSAPRHPPYTLNSLTNLECLADRRILSLQSSIQLSMNSGIAGIRAREPARDRASQEPGWWS